MSIIRTDYMTPMSQMGATIGGAVKDIGETVARIPEEARKERIEALNEEKLMNDKKYQKEKIGAAWKYFEENAKMIPADAYKVIESRFKAAIDSPSAQAVEDVATFIYNYGTLDNVKQEIRGEDPDWATAFENVYPMNGSTVSRMFDDENYGKTIQAQAKENLKSRKQSKLEDYAMAVKEKMPDASLDEVLVQLTNLTRTDDSLKNTTVEELNKVASPLFRTRSDIESGSLKEREVKVKERQAGVAEKRTSIAASKEARITENKPLHRNITKDMADAVAKLQTGDKWLMLSEEEQKQQLQTVKEPFEMKLAVLEEADQQIDDATAAKIMGKLKKAEYGSPGSLVYRVAQRLGYIKPDTSIGRTGAAPAPAPKKDFSNFKR